MKLLVDSQLLLITAGSPDRLQETARALLEDPENELLFRVASFWEQVHVTGVTLLTSDTLVAQYAGPIKKL